MKVLNMNIGAILSYITYGVTTILTTFWGHNVCLSLILPIPPRPPCFFAKLDKLLGRPFQKCAFCCSRMPTSWIAVTLILHTERHPQAISLSSIPCAVPGIDSWGTGWVCCACVLCSLIWAPVTLSSHSVLPLLAPYVTSAIDVSLLSHQSHSWPPLLKQMASMLIKCEAIFLLLH